MLSAVKRSVKTPALRGGALHPREQVLAAVNARGFATSPYIEETVIPTYHFQDSLPKLPVPKLEDTLERYKYFAQPVVSEATFDTTSKLCDSFLNGEGKALQEELVAKDKAKYSSFISEPWFDMYLKSRDPLMINVNPQLTFNDAPDSSRMDQASRAATLVTSSARFYRTLKDEKLSPDIFHTKPKDSETDRYKTLMKWIPRKFAFYGSYYYGAFPLDMSQYGRLFSSTRIPKNGKDELVTYEPSESRHVIVQRGSEFYKLYVLNEDGSIKDYGEIKSQIEGILARPLNNSSPAVGVLTSMERNAWASAREELVASPVNKQSIHDIDSALFALCLDDEGATTHDDLNRLMLHGKGRNRWFDKSFQLIVAANGKAAVNFEHAWGDGVAVLRYFNMVFNDSNSLATDTDPSAPKSQEMNPLQFDLSDSLCKIIGDAGSEADRFISSLELFTLESDLISRRFCKENKLGADGYLQMSFQLAHEKLHGKTVPTYESASTSGFKHGRTETIRSATPEAASFAKLFVEGSASKEAKAAALKKAITKHGEITKDALLGKGMDRHMFALRTLAEEKGKTLDIFTDETYQTMNKIILSTSTLASPALLAGGFGPVNQDCYGIGYGINDEAFRVGVASYYRGSKEFVDAVEESAREMRDVIV
mmetsp:Transcript_10075/g.12103  ORF Transcript_10075/g.12103 Transcript_10075/m.12103 type:complete len:652 (-) Transcript_10075:26-1981(-)